MDIKYSSQEGMRSNLCKIVKDLDKVSLELNRRTECAIECRLFSRIGTATSEQLNFLSEHLNGPIEVTANVVRTTFEINVVLRYCLNVPEYITAFRAQSGADEISLWKAIRDLAHEETSLEALDGINSHIENIRETLTRNNLPLKPVRVSIKQMAKEVGLEKEYQTMYAIYSKYVHASAWFVLRPRQQIDLPMYRLPMLANCQLHAADTLYRLQQKIAPK